MNIYISVYNIKDNILGPNFAFLVKLRHNFASIIYYTLTILSLAT